MKSNETQFITQYQYQEWKRLGCNSAEFRRINDDYLPLGPLKNLDLRRNRTLEFYFHQGREETTDVMVIGDFEAQEGSAFKRDKRQKRYLGVEREIVQSRQQQEVIPGSAVDVDVGNADADAVMVLLGPRGIDNVINGGEKERAVTVPLKKRRKKQQAMEAVVSMHEQAVSVSVIAEPDVAEVTGQETKKKSEKKVKEKGKEKTRKIAAEVIDESGQQVCKKKRKTPLLNHWPAEKEVEKDVIHWDCAAKSESLPDC
jgi:hypothetical protein